MPKIALTAKAISGLAIPESGRVDYQDTTLPGLVLRVSSTGTKSYSVSWWNGTARPRVTLGVTDDSPKRGPGTEGARLSLADARDAAKEVLRGVRVGSDPARERRERRAAATFEELGNEYIARWATERKSPRGAREDQLRIERVLFPRWRHLKASDIRRRDVIELLDSYADAGKTTARNRIQSLISKVFNFGIARDLVESNPARGIDREPEAPRERVLSDDELRTVLGLLDRGDVAALGFRLLLLTGQRPGEVFGARWSEIVGNTWNIPADRTKAGRATAVPLSVQALSVLTRARATGRGARGSEFVFPSRISGQPLASYAKAAERIRRESKLPDWRIYDLRSTVLTGLQRLGVAPHIVSAVANHAPATVTTRHYAMHDYADEKREALDAWGAHVAALEAPARKKAKSRAAVTSRTEGRQKSRKRATR